MRTWRQVFLRRFTTGAPRYRSVGGRELFRVCLADPPALFDPAHPPYHEGDGPDPDEQPDDDEAGTVDIEVAGEVPEPPGPAELSRYQPDDLEATDVQRHRDGEEGDGDVVVHLADRLGEGPTVGEVHERAVHGVQQGHAGGE